MTNELRCTAGQAVQPTAETCHRHPDHHWCGYCAGWYGVPHSTVAGVCHTEQWVRTRHVDHAHATCACRYCRLFWTHGAAQAWALLEALSVDLPQPAPEVPGEALDGSVGECGPDPRAVAARFDVV